MYIEGDPRKENELDMEDVPKERQREWRGKELGDYQEIDGWRNQCPGGTWNDR